MISPSTASAIRYSMITLHVLLWLVSLPLSAVLLGSVLMLILHSCAGVALLVYIPATVYLSLKNSSSTFDQAGGEVAYAVIQICCWLGCAIYGIIASVFSENACRDGFSLNDVYSSAPYAHRPFLEGCTVLMVIIAFAFVELALMTGWVVWLSCLAHRVPGMDSKVAFALPAHRLVRGQVGWTELGEAGETGVKKGKAGEADTAGRGWEMSKR